MPPKTIAIVGAGIAGLAAGCYAQMNGYRSVIFELHDIPGGLCTSWERKGYVFDGAIHYLFGSGAGQPFNAVWQELGVYDGLEFVHHPEFMRVVASSGRTLTLYADPDRLEEHLVELAPEDAELSRWFVDSIRRFERFDLSLLAQEPRALMDLRDGMELGRRMISFAPDLARWGFGSAQEFAARFADPFLRRAIPVMFGWPEIPMIAALMQMAYMHTGNAGFPVGGSLEFARRLERAYLALGGEIRYNSQVERILVADDRAVGVRLYSDETAPADYVISACDGRGTIFTLLDGQYVDKRIRSLYDGHLPILSEIQVSLGVARDLSTEPHWTTYLLDEPVRIADRARHEFGFKHYCFDPSLAPPGRSALTVLLPSDYDYWQRIYGHPLYRSEQEQVADQVIAQFEQHLPGLSRDIEVVDVATPVSYERYTGNWQGATTGWLPAPETIKLLLRGVDQTLPGLRNFYMAGQWVEPGGSVPLAAMSGRKALQLLCHDEDKPFVTA
jgi:phytoene dehydrogenase-like protein